MKKRILSLALALTMLMGISAVSFANSPSIVVNNQTMALENESFIDENGRLMLPLRSLLEKMNYLVRWKDEDKSVNFSKDSKEVVVKIASKELNVNGNIENISRAPIIEEARTFVPAELLDESLDAVLSWNSKKRILGLRDIKKKNEEIFNMSKDKETIQKLEEYMDALVEYENFNGSILLAKEGEILLNKGYGYADLSQRIENKSQTRFGIGSLTKQFAAFASLKLSEEGLLNLEDKVSKYLPDFPHGDDISIYNLLTHTSGLVGYTDVEEFLSVDITNRDPNKMLDLVRDMDLLFSPGETFQYSNTNYLAIGMIIEKISGESFEEYLGTIVKPLGMDDTGLIFGERGGRNDATPYSGYLEIAEIDDDLVTSQAYAAGSIYSTVEDLYRWDRALRSGEILKKEVLDDMFKEQVAIPGAGSYGYGWMIDESDMGKEIYHGGNTMGFTAYMGNLVEEDLTVIILSNVGVFNTDELKDDLYSIVLEKDYEMPEEIKTIQIEDKDLYKEYVGKYNLITGMEIDIFEKEGKLFAQGTGQEAFELYPKSKTEFFARVADINIEFIVGEDGLVKEFILIQSGLEFLGKKEGSEEEKVEVEIDPKVYDDYLGEYKIVEGLIATISVEDGKIYAQLTGQPKAEIFPSSETEFFYKVVDANISFEKDAEGNVTGLILDQMGQRFKAPKIK